ncbi:MAG TPA: ABC transporter ATP-binding protein [Candidatus Limnocylindrales bacterium]|nr:ABC transporter ATP-binding protein [Candidatus Limnocylindrales bacterium]
MSIFEATDVTVERAGRVVARAAHLLLEPGETLAILGPNGAGKSSLLLALAALVPCGGALRIGDTTPRDRLAYRRRVGMVFQRPLLLDRSVRENAGIGLSFRGVPPRERAERADSSLALLGIGALADRRGTRLSGGEAQRVSIARALALRPEVLFLDEPFAGLDAPTRSALISDLGRVLRDAGVATLLVTHDRDEALALADRVAVMIDGNVRQIGRTDEVFARPVDEAVAAFVGVENVLPALVVGSTDEMTTLRVGGALVSATAAAPSGNPNVLLLISPDDVVIARSRGTSSERNAFEGRITNVETIGRRVRVTLDCGFPLVAHVTRQSSRDLGLATAENVTASFKATVPHLLARGT